jgi:hypothetical protein
MALTCTLDNVFPAVPLNPEMGNMGLVFLLVVKMNGHTQ